MIIKILAGIFGLLGCLIFFAGIRGLSDEKMFVGYAAIAFMGGGMAFFGLRVAIAKDLPNVNALETTGEVPDSTLPRPTPSNNEHGPRLVTIATFPTLLPAETAKLILAEEGIRSFIIDSNTVLADWFLGPALGWIKLQVADADAVTAATFIEKHPRLVANPSLNSSTIDDTLKCLSCGQPLAEDARSCPACHWTYSDGTSMIDDEPVTISSTNFDEEPDQDEQPKGPT